MGNKAILMSIQPQWVKKILNGEKTIEVRKKFPKDYVGWVYIYCTKGKDYLYEIEDEDTNGFSYKLHKECNVEEWEAATETLNGKVVARFWCDKISELECEFWEEPLFDENSCYQAVKLIERDLDYPDEEQLWNYHEMVSNEDGYTDEEVYKESKFLQKCCLSLSEIKKYVGVGGETRCFGIHISKLEVFDNPKELKELKKPCDQFIDCLNCKRFEGNENIPHCREITKAPQSYMFVEDTL